jgi:hypothetical protein
MLDQTTQVIGAENFPSFHRHLKSGIFFIAAQQRIGVLEVFMS